MIQLTHASVFSGIGAPEIAAEMLGWQNAFHCEINPFGRSILDYYFPNSKSYEDIKKTDFSEWRGKIDILTGGFPCQPFSYAGKRKGAKDDRYLWKYMLRCVQQVQPTWFIGENVVGITTMVFPNNGVKVASDADLFGDGNNIYRRNERYVLNEICENLEQEGYSVQPLLIPACAVQAPHRRDRIWIIAHRDGSIANTFSDGSRTQEPSGQVESDRNNGLSQQSERSYETERTNRLPTLQGYVTDTEDMQRNGGEFGECRKQEEKPQFRNDNSKTITNTNLQRCDKSNVTTEPNQKKRLDCKTDTNRRNKNELIANSDNERYKQTSIEGAMEAKAPGKHQSNNITDYKDLLPANRWRAFPTVSPVYRGNDGLPFDVDSLTIPYLKSKKKKDHFSEWKKESLKAYGNAWCVQVGYEIMRAIGEIENDTNI